MYKCSKPILFVIFNRADTSKLVFEAIRNVKPPRLYISADGPRTNRKGEDLLSAETRKVVETIDWDCQVFHKFSDVNLGMKEAEASAFDWFFDNEEDGIILEDDTLPDETFFSFCENMLDYYKNDTRIMHISGCNLQFGKKWGDGSYYFSRHVTCWGWAGWRRAWKYYDKDIKNFPKFKQLGHLDNDILVGDRNKWQYKWMINSIYNGRPTWDYQWSFTVLSQHGLCITPNVSLITNIGFGENSTTSYYTKTKLAKIKLESLTEIIHPTFVLDSVKADYYFNKLTFNQIPILLRIYNKLLKIVKQKLKTK